MSVAVKLSKLWRNLIKASRQTLTTFVTGGAELITPTSYALLSSILKRDVLATDETTFKAGRAGQGKLL